MAARLQSVLAEQPTQGGGLTVRFAGPYLLDGGARQKIHIILEVQNGMSPDGHAGTVGVELNPGRIEPEFWRGFHHPVIAWRRGVQCDKFEVLAQRCAKSSYGEYLLDIHRSFSRSRRAEF